MTVVDVWLVDAAVTAAEPALLDAAERARHAALGHSVDRHRFVVAHAAVRRVVAARLGVPPAEVCWTRGPNGKPLLVGGALEVNLSHSGDLVLIAVAGDRPVGVDVQQVLPGLDVVAMAERFYPPAEAALVASGGPGRFAELWARKEAVVKAAGDRLTRGLSLPVAGPSPWSVAHDDGAYVVADLDAPDGFRAAVALAGAEPFEVRAHDPNVLTHR
ncbi:4'-phosphopantetheinyl transferase superfamily protein [Dactylosporangium fulvum]|uniref:4'-phosphopantetheinyl transferase superfamily protein n=1 Tax=Dactylosporangium fulvum TaxID=53359 RepID=A0ABY5W8E7_9ACTN|nr:4'-phosphopantetheinyl transferase superfamily protein [Dactylosporangium fulvum]UWP84973.1 4'-phosphopantetheinyl transferase superfamily protein [Dactylosporangium fulvum]